MSGYRLQRRSTSAPKELRVESLASAVVSTVHIALLPNSFDKLLVLQSDPYYDQEKQNNDRQFPPFYKGNVGQKNPGHGERMMRMLSDEFLAASMGFPRDWIRSVLVAEKP